MISPGEIVYCIITAKNKKGKVFTTPPTIFSCPYTGFKPELSLTDQYDVRIIEKAGAKENLTITRLDIISRHGFRNK